MNPKWVMSISSENEWIISYEKHKIVTNWQESVCCVIHSFSTVATWVQSKWVLTQQQNMMDFSVSCWDFDIDASNKIIQFLRAVEAFKCPFNIILCLRTMSKSKIKQTTFSCTSVLYSTLNSTWHWGIVLMFYWQMSPVRMSIVRKREQHKSTSFTVRTGLDRIKGLTIVNE